MAKLRSSGSMRLRLVAMLITTGAIMAALLVLVFQSFARQITADAQDSQLLASASSILESATLDNGELQIDIPYSAFSMLGSVSDDRVFYQIALKDRVLSGYDGLVAPMTETGTDFQNENFLDADVRVASTARIIGLGEGRSILTVSVAQTQESMNQQLQAISRRAIGIGMGFFMVASLLAFFVSFKVFQPLEQLARSVSRRGPSDLTPIKQVVPDEMGTLVGALNDFTFRLNRALAGSQEFITEAAHRIRTPLTTVRTQAELCIRRTQNEQNRKSLRALIQAVDETTRTSGQLLDHAMINLRSDALSRSKVEIGAFISQIIDRIRPVADLRDIDIEFKPHDAPGISGDPVMLERAISNVIDNSLKYAPEESRITLTTKNEANSLVIEITDQGPGFADDQPTDLFKRFQRGETAEGTVGSGLGLTIARDVVLAHGGTIKLQNSPKGGACVLISLPH